MRSNYVAFLENIVANDLFVTTDKYLEFSKEEGFLYVKRDFLFRPGKWRGKIEIPPHYRIFGHHKIVITGHSDYLTNQNDLRRFHVLNGSKMILGTNMVPVAKISASLPLGLTNDCDDTPIHRILGSTKHFAIAHGLSEFQEFYDSSMYLNFTSANNVGQRSFLLDLLKDRKRTFIEFPEMSDKGRVSYLKNLKAHCFVPCPEGNGIDTHRLWETLYMGGIPIILKNPAIDELVKDLPVVRLNNWREILDEEFLHSEWLRVQSADMDPGRLSVTFWLNYIKTVSSHLGNGSGDNEDY